MTSHFEKLQGDLLAGMEQVLTGISDGTTSPEADLSRALRRLATQFRELGSEILKEQGLKALSLEIGHGRNAVPVSEVIDQVIVLRLVNWPVWTELTGSTSTSGRRVKKVWGRKRDTSVVQGGIEQFDELARKLRSRLREILAFSVYLWFISVRYSEARLDEWPGLREAASDLESLVRADRREEIRAISSFRTLEPAVWRTELAEVVRFFTGENRKAADVDKTSVDALAEALLEFDAQHRGRYESEAVAYEPQNLLSTFRNADGVAPLKVLAKLPVFEQAAEQVGLPFDEKRDLPPRGDKTRRPAMYEVWLQLRVVETVRSRLSRWMTRMRLVHRGLVPVLIDDFQQSLTEGADAPADELRDWVPDFDTAVRDETIKHLEDLIRTAPKPLAEAT